MPIGLWCERTSDELKEWNWLCSIQVKAQPEAAACEALGGMTRVPALSI